MLTSTQNNQTDRSTLKEVAAEASRRAARLLLIGIHPTLMPDPMRQEFPVASYIVDMAPTGAAGIEEVRNNPPDVILMEVLLPDISGLEAHRLICRTNPQIPVIFVTRTKNSDSAIEAIKQGAFDYLVRPIDMEDLRRVVDAALAVSARRRSRAVAGAAASPIESVGDMFGNCPAMCEVYKSIGRVAAQNIPVLITGESGTGKEVVARAICAHGSRARQPFLALNCAAIPEQLLESELFGHEKGAFNGADRRRIGKFEQCNGGTILLDEIGDMPLVLQAKILRLLQEQTFHRVGGTETVQTDVRIIAATHRDLKARAISEKFRLDLYYRLSVFNIHLPPLRDRGEDIPLLVRQYLRQFSRELGREINDIAPEAMDRLQNYSWPGNIRELQSVLKQSLLRASGTTLLPGFLPELRGSFEPASQTAIPGNVGLETFIRQRLTAGASDLYTKIHNDVDRRFLSVVLQHTHGNQREAARILGIARQTLRQKRRELGLQITHTITADADDDVLELATN